MKLKVNKAALSLSTAFLMVSSIFSTVTSAAATNLISISTDKTVAKAGDKINLTISLTPDNDGVAGFTINLHYDPDKASVYVPSDDEFEGKYNLTSEFSVIANYSASEDTVKIVGANLTGSNVKENTSIALAEFTVNDDAFGDLDYWIEVETLVKSSGDSYETAAYTAPGKDSPYTVSLSEPVTTTVTTSQTTSQTETTKTTEIAQTTKKSEEISSSSSETSINTTEITQAEITQEKSTTTTEIYKNETTSTDVSTTAVTEISSNKQEEISETKITTESVKNSENEEINVTDSQILDENDTEIDSKTEEQDNSIFSYTQNEYDFNSEQALQYGFNLSDYVSDYNKNYDIKFNIETTGNVSGGIGMMVNNVWTYSSQETQNSQQDSWVYENLDPNSSSDLIYLQIYYLAANSNFEIKSIEVTPVTEQPSEQKIEDIQVVGDSLENNVDDSVQENYSENNDEQQETDENFTAQIEDNADYSEETDDIEDDNALEENSDEQDDISQDAADDAQTDDFDGETDEIDQDANNEIEENSNSAKEEEITAAVEDAAKIAESTTSNPDTGFGEITMNILTIAALLEIAFSIFAIIFNKLNADKE